MTGQPARIEAVEAEPLSVPLREPFVIASARMEVTAAALVRVRLVRGERTAEGLGEAATFPPVTDEDRASVLAAIAAAAPVLRGVAIAAPHDLGEPLDRALAGRPVARAAIETAALDAFARLEGVPLATLLAGDAHAPALETDVTLPIAAPHLMVALARRWHARGFRCFKVKVGRAWHEDGAALRAVHDALPDVRFRIDANQGFSARDALALLEDALGAGLAIELFEQPCPRADLAAMAEVAARSPVPVIADESVRSEADLEAVLRAHAARGVNLKLVKHGGPLATLAIARRARREGLSLMAGAMVETKLGLSAMAHVVAALGGVEWVDLDTAWLLAEDPFEGGLEGDGPGLSILSAPGLGIARRRG